MREGFTAHQQNQVAINAVFAECVFQCMQSHPKAFADKALDFLNNIELESKQFNVLRTSNSRSISSPGTTSNQAEPKPRLHAASIKFSMALWLP